MDRSWRAGGHQRAAPPPRVDKVVDNFVDDALALFGGLPVSSQEPPGGCSGEAWEGSPGNCGRVTGRIAPSPTAV